MPTALTLARGRLEADRTNERDVAKGIVRPASIRSLKAIAGDMHVAAGGA